MLIYIIPPPIYFNEMQVNRFNPQLIELETEDVRVTFNPHDDLHDWYRYSDSWRKSSEEPHDRNYPVGRKKFMQHLVGIGNLLEDLPFRCTVGPKISHNNDFEGILNEINYLMRRVAKPAGLIADHSMFDKSEVWYMFCVCHRYQKFEDYYGFMNNLGDMQEMLNTPYFLDMSGKSSMLDIYFNHSLENIIIDFGMDKNTRGMGYFKNGVSNIRIGVNHRLKAEAIEFVKRWGIETVNLRE